MLGVTVFRLLLTPVFYVLIRRLTDSKKSDTPHSSARRRPRRDIMSKPLTERQSQDLTAGSVMAMQGAGQRPSSRKDAGMAKRASVRKGVVALTIAAVRAGCAVGPNYKRTETRVRRSLPPRRRAPIRRRKIRRCSSGGSSTMTRWTNS